MANKLLALALTGPLVIPMGAATATSPDGQADAAPAPEPSTSTQPIPILHAQPVVAMGMHPKADSWEGRAIARVQAERKAAADRLAEKIAKNRSLAIAAAHQKAVEAADRAHAAQVAQAKAAKALVLKSQAAQRAAAAKTVAATAKAMAQVEAEKPNVSIKLAPVTPAKSIPVATFSRASVFAVAKRYLGVPYVFGGSSTRGIDCSGLVMVALGKFGIHVPHSARAIAQRGYRIPTSQARIGDLVYFPAAGHIAFWAGPGMILEAAHPGTRVRIHAIWSSNYYVVRIIR